MSVIKKIEAKEILDSRGSPTLLVTCELATGASGNFAVPSGKSTGSREAIELRDHDMERYNGLGVLGAVENVNVEISDNILEKEFDQNSLDQTLRRLDGTENKSRLGANAILGVSVAFAKAVALEKNLALYEYLGGLIGNKNFQLPTPLLNIINGGKHADSGLSIQEFMIVPHGLKTFKEKIEISEKIISALENILKEENKETTLGDEGGFAPKLGSTDEAIQKITQAIIRAGYTEMQVQIALDCAATSFYDSGKYKLQVSGEIETKTSEEMISWYEKLVANNSIVLIEDPLAEDDWQGFINMKQKLGEKIKIVGDDLTVTNTKLIQRAIEKSAVNAVLVKLNQIGTVSETIEAIELTKRAGWTPIISHRSGETMDTFIADLAIGLGCPYIKSGSLRKPERMCKYERLIEIEKNILKK